MRLLLILVTAALPSLALAQTYTVTVLAPQYSGSSSFALSNDGAAVGSGFNTGVPGTHGFIWQNGQLTVISPLPAGYNSSNGWGVNENGDVVGELMVNSARQGAFRRSAAGVLTALPGFSGGTAPGYRLAEDINDAGQIVGYAVLPTSFSHIRAAVWQPDNTITNLGDLPGGIATHAYSITNAGVVSGISGVLPHDRVLAYRYDPVNGMVDLGTLGGMESRVGWAINEAGVVVGFAHTGPVGQVDNWPIFHAFRWSDGVMTDLGVQPGDNHSYATAINNHGDIVGLGMFNNGALEPQPRALLWRNGQIIDLNTRIPPGTGYHLRVANAINDSGWILVEGSQSLFQPSRALLLIPMP
jgi:probable HAF family extracellular repeat protein